MLKQKLLRTVVGLALLLALTGASSIIGDSFGLGFTPSAHACSTAGSGGNC